MRSLHWTHCGSKWHRMQRSWSSTRTTTLPPYMPCVSVSACRTQPYALIKAAGLYLHMLYVRSTYAWLSGCCCSRQRNYTNSAPCYLLHQEGHVKRCLFLPACPGMVDAGIAVDVAHAAANRWLDNNFALLSYCRKKFPNSQAELAKLFQEVCTVKLRQFKCDHACTLRPADACMQGGCCIEPGM